MTCILVLALTLAILLGGEGPRGRDAHAATDPSALLGFPLEVQEESSRDREEQSGEAPAAVLVTFDGWTFRYLDLVATNVYYEADVTAENLRRLLVSIQIATTAVPEALGVADAQKRSHYLFGSGDAFRAALHQLAGVPQSEISGAESGYSWGRPPFPGTYYNTAALDEEGTALWDVTHELTHEMEAALAQGRSFPQWFSEGVAELIAGEVTRAHYPEYSARRRFLAGARLANAARTGSVPSLVPLVSTSQWVTASVHDWGLYYDSASLAVAQLVQRSGRDAPARTLSSVGAGGQFDRAFLEVFGLPVAETERLLTSAAGALDPQFPPGLLADRAELLSSERIQIVFLGVKPGEEVNWSFTGPGRCRGGQSTTATPAGFASYFFYLDESSQNSCAGLWTLEAHGNQGSQGRYTFTFTGVPAP